MFADIEDVEAWLEPMTYEEFWEDIRSYNLVMPDRAYCDRQIKTAAVENWLMLAALKHMARVELCNMLRLDRRIDAPISAHLH